MNFNNLIHGNIGLIHTVFASIALIAGTTVLIKQKGSKFHKQIGYIYAASMVVMLITAFMLYNLYGSFGIFHFFAVVSTFTLLAGMMPIIRGKPTNYISLHWNFMYWSVFGLYAAFVAETLVRIPQVVIESGIPNTTFYNMVGIGVGIVMGIAYFVLNRKKKDWEKFEKRQEIFNE